MPAELRVMVYEALVVGSEPITVLREEQTNETHQLDLSLLRVNRQIHDEAAAVFYCKNTFCIRPGKGKDVCGGVPAPRYLHLVRHLKVEGFLHPDTPGKAWAKKQGGLGQDGDGNQENERYISILTTLLPQLRNLHTIHLTITPPDRLSSKSVLAALLPLKHALPSILASLSPLVPILLSFEFDDCYCRLRVSPEFLRKDCLVLLPLTRATTRLFFNDSEIPHFTTQPSQDFVQISHMGSG
ncbi:uncharacterized protein CC84DRAFT_1218456 [Paraphaeosphaeria sporulosa]|uniref:Uncharacterized protein n=1 Tax=Paraphaeosphaeria sporulosa TaxID=1460663 RepID=A0A177CE40_9PLEO|nr:uncharacterized protein CC84DRAFT_1218456 [Paraphaeosphaeria sporulosa]OAG05069.1 hypothetical protein CC84DRAFT_1218456 [Paraphaeosphaeria sporulosa]